MTVFFQTDHLQLTDRCDSDDASLSAARWDTSTMHQLTDGEIKPWEPASYEFLVGGSRQGDREIYIVRDQTGLAIGWAGLTMIQLKNRGAVVVLSVSEIPNRSQMLVELLRLIMEIAFTERNLHRLQLAVPADNDELVDLMLKAHFVREGCNQAGLFHSGQRIDCYEYGLLQDEWQANQRAVTR